MTVGNITARGMLSALYAAANPHGTALISDRRLVTFRDLDLRANRLAQVFQSAGLKPGDAVALIAPNTPEVVETYLACMRSGLRLTPISRRLEPGTILYIVRDCSASALITHADAWPGLFVEDVAHVRVRLAVGASIPGFTDYEAALEGASADPPAAAILGPPEPGQLMFYTSGTTGRPKGVAKSRSRIFGREEAVGLAGYREGDVNLLCGPAFHSAPFFHDVILPVAAGVPVVMMERFDPQRALELIEQHRVTHTHMVSAMFQRLLRLPDENRRSFDLSSLRRLNHGGAPTPVDVKFKMMNWLGPVLYEYYAATEGGGVRIGPQEWLGKPGSVGRPSPREQVRIIDEDGAVLPTGQAGSVYFLNGKDGSLVSYHNDPERTQEVFGGDYFTVGDIGYLDPDGYLFLTGRSADRIVSGGVNIHPQEIDDVLMRHPLVRFACCVGAPSEEWGEEVRAIICADVSTDAERGLLAAELLDIAHAHVAAYKVPKAFDFVDEIPVDDSGKVNRARLRARYWAGRPSQI